MNVYSTRHWKALLVMAAVFATAPQVAAADRTVAVFFRGFGATPGSAGMDLLAADLASSFGGDPTRPYSSEVFAWTEQQEAFDFIDGFTDIGCVILVGHSFGANSAIELVTDFLTPSGIHVDLLIQFDSVGASDDVLPAEVGQGLNFHQISTGLFEPQGTSNVVGSMNEQVEASYGVANSDITHTSIDCPLFAYSPPAYAALFGSQPDLYARIEDLIAALCASAVPSLGPISYAILLLMFLASGYRVGREHA